MILFTSPKNEVQLKTRSVASGGPEDESVCVHLYQTPHHRPVNDVPDWKTREPIVSADRNE